MIKKRPKQATFKQRRPYEVPRIIEEEVFDRKLLLTCGKTLATCEEDPPFQS